MFVWGHVRTNVGAFSLINIGRFVVWECDFDEELIIAKVFTFFLTLFITFKDKAGFPSASLALLKDDFRIEGLAKTVFEVFKGTYSSFLKKFNSLRHVQFMAGNIFIQLEFTLTLRAVIIPVCLL